MIFDFFFIVIIREEIAPENRGAEVEPISGARAWILGKWFSFKMTSALGMFLGASSKFYFVGRGLCPPVARRVCEAPNFASDGCIRLPLQAFHACTVQREPYIHKKKKILQMM